MKTARLAALVAFSLLTCLAHATLPLGNGFTYQGQLKDGNAPANGAYDMTFTVFDAATGGNQVGPALTGNDIPVAGGVFSTTLDFGSTVFTGTARWLEIAVRPGGSVGSYTTLTPRQPLTPAPYALFSAAPWLTNGYTINYNLGNVGIGAALPICPLDVRGAATSTGAITGLQTSGSTAGAGVYGKSNVSNGNGVIGEANGNSAYGVWGKSDTGYAGYFQGKGYFSGDVGIGTSSPTARFEIMQPGSSLGLRVTTQGAFGMAIDATATSTGIHATATADGGHAAEFNATATNADGIYATGYMANSRGITAAAGNGQGVHAAADSGYAIYAFSNGVAGHFSGDVEVLGSLSKPGGSFKIDHPLDPANKFLYHSFVESPDMLNIYNGVVTTDARGYATVTMPTWFEALNRDFRYQLTVIDNSDSETFVQAKVTRRIENGAFTIRTSVPNTEVSWLVTGVRRDAWAEANRIPVEQDKSAAQRGKFMHPELFGQPAEMGMYFESDQIEHPAPPQDGGRIAPAVGG